MSFLQTAKGMIRTNEPAPDEAPFWLIMLGSQIIDHTDDMAEAQDMLRHYQALTPYEPDYRIQLNMQIFGKEGNDVLSDAEATGC